MRGAVTSSLQRQGRALPLLQRVASSTTRLRARTTSSPSPSSSASSSDADAKSGGGLGLGSVGGLPGSPFSTAALEGVTNVVIEASKGTGARVDAPDAEKTLVFVNESREAVGAAEREGESEGAGGLPAVYDRDAIQRYWDGRPGELTRRWGEFVRLNVPFLTRVATILLSGGSLASEAGKLSKDARIIMEKLGPTYIKLGQMLSVRPDVLPEEARKELEVLQDSVKPFEASKAREMVEKSLGRPLEDVFSDFSEEPVAAASLAQVHRATLRATGQRVAVKVQRPNITETVSKDLYVLRRAAEVYQSIMDRFAPQQNTDYVALLNEWAIGFYTELDFKNEAANQTRMRQMLAEQGVRDVYVLLSTPPNLSLSLSFSMSEVITN